MELITLKRYGILYLIWAVLDLVGIIVNFFDGPTTVEVMDAFSLPYTIAFMTIILSHTNDAVYMLFHAYLGYKGVQYGNGRGKGKAFIIVAKVYAVFSIIELVGFVIDSGIMDILSAVIEVIVIISYIKVAKRVIE